MRNFDYLKEIPALSDLHYFCDIAEETQTKFPHVSAQNCRLALEWIVKAIYKLKSISVDPKDSLYELMTGDPFVSFVEDDRIMMAAHYVRKVGNAAAHDGKASGKQSFFCLLNLYNLIGAILLKLRVLNTLAPFDKNLIPGAPEKSVVSIRVVPEVKGSFTESVDEKAVEKPAAIPEGAIDYSEAETRRLFIDLMLADAGWEVMTNKGAIVPGKACIEIELEGMPNDAGVGYADYVLFANDGKPLAVVEAKRTTKDPSVGRHQAQLYADLIEKKYGIRPVIYYTNGYTTTIIDGLGYPDRNVLGFHTQNDLEILIQRRSRSQITDLKVKDEITDREYQKRGIRAICEHFNSNHRRGLLVMATGTGKTRVSISLVDVLMRNKWAKNILFLADRTALVSQAKRNFVKLLPDVPMCVLSEQKDPDLNARIIFSTYQTMINYIDTDEKLFSIGRFDLIIIDEAHRSVFGKYNSILDYFDALIVGLTATPREDVDRSTYDLFQLEGGEPNFAYELDEAVEDGYLNYYDVIPRTTSILQQGIKYNDLTEEEKKQMDEIWKYEALKNGALYNLDQDTPDKHPGHRDIHKNEIFKYIFNVDTIDKVLTDLMDNGQKIHGGDMLGKSIIFAYNHQHADLIVQRFRILYPQYGEEFCVLIDNYVNYAKDLIENFEMRDKMPQIAVSVDMLDTGIDVPDILNLVFFKPVYSKIKFFQMIGRGTRLSPGVFGPGKDKGNFYIFDWCGVFEYFGKNPKGKEPLPTISLTERLFGLRLDLACALQHSKYQSEEYPKSLHDEMKRILLGQVKELNDNHISVRQQWEMVDKYRKEDNWVYVSTLDALDIKAKIGPLLVKGTTDEAAKRFDVLVLNVQFSMVSEDVQAENSKTGITQVAEKLQEKGSIPQVAAKMNLIKELASPTFWESASLQKLEHVRNEIRDLVKFILGESGKKFIIDIDDVVLEGASGPAIMPKMSYKQRVIDYLAKNRNLPVLQKIFNIQKLTQKDIAELEEICWKELGTKEEYQRYIEKGKMICGDSVAAFIRSQIGVDRVVAVQQFSKFLSGHNLNSLQEEYLKTIITYVCENGDITTSTLVQDSPFCDFDWIETFGQNTIYIKNYVENLHDVIVA